MGRQRASSGKDLRSTWLAAGNRRVGTSLVQTRGLCQPSPEVNVLYSTTENYKAQIKQMNMKEDKNS